MKRYLCMLACQFITSLRRSTTKCELHSTEQHIPTSCQQVLLYLGTILRRDCKDSVMDVENRIRKLACFCFLNYFIWR